MADIGPNAGQPMMEGRSTTQSQADDYTKKALAAGVPQSHIDSFLASNPGDYNRLISSYTSGRTGSGQDTNAPSSGGSGQTGGGSNPGMASMQSFMNAWGQQQGAQQQRADGLYNTLLDRSKQSLNINPNDPIIAGQVNSYKADQTRASRNYVDSLAERNGPTANLDAERRMAAEHVAQGAGNLQSTLIGNELTARRGEIQNALTQMGGMLSDQQRLALEQQLGLIDANLRQQGLNSGNDQWAAEFGRSLTNDANYWDTRRLGI